MSQHNNVTALKCHLTGPYSCGYKDKSYGTCAITAVRWEQYHKQDTRPRTLHTSHLERAGQTALLANRHSRIVVIWGREALSNLGRDTWNCVVELVD